MEYACVVIPKIKIKELYITEGKSMQEISLIMKCSVNAVTYWMNKYGIKRRSISDAIYGWHNPTGDPFKFRLPRTARENRLFGLGLGLYWGEGTKANKGAIRLGNSDPKLIKVFINFLITFFSIRKEDLKFGLQIFSDIDPSEALDFWTKALKIDKSQFQKPVVTISGSLGTYRKKSQYGVVTVHYNNKKARDLLISFLPM